MSKKERHKEKLENTKRRDLRIIWNSNGPNTNSGYAAETRDLLFRFVKDNWNVACIAFWGLDGFPAYQYGQDLIDDRFKDVKLKVYPKMDHPYGSDALILHSIDYKANVIFTMQDVPMLDPQHLQQLKYWIPFLPIDKDPCPPAVLERLRYAYKIVTFSKFGQDTLLKAGFTSTLIYEGTDTELFKPMDKLEMRRDYKIPEDVFLFGMIAANKENPPRKGYQEALEAFKLFYDKHPEARLFIHSQQRGPGGFPVEDFARTLGFHDKMFLYEPYRATYGSNHKDVSKQMNMFDVLLHPSQTEGFGLTVIEALACGTPVIVNNTTSMPEMVTEGVNGWICNSQEKGRFTNDLSYVYPADVNSLYEKMELAYKAVKENEAKLSEDCRNSVLAKYNVDSIYENNWRGFLEELQEEILPLQEPLKVVELNQSNIVPSK